MAERINRITHRRFVLCPQPDRAPAMKMHAGHFRVQAPAVVLEYHLRSNAQPLARMHERDPRLFVCERLFGDATLVGHPFMGCLWFDQKTLRRSPARQPLTDQARRKYPRVVDDDDITRSK